MEIFILNFLVKGIQFLVRIIYQYLEPSQLSYVPNIITVSTVAKFCETISTII